MPDVTVKVDTSVLDEILENLDAKGVYLKAGILESATGAETSSGKAKRIHPASYAYKHEFGIGVPQRAFLRPTVHQKSDKWIEKIGILLKRNDFDIVTSLEQIRTTVTGDIVRTITKAKGWKPLSPATIEYKRAMKYDYPESPLQATRTMITSIDSEVVGK